jgi:hypothetical protein
VLTSMMNAAGMRNMALAPLSEFAMMRRYHTQR